jgi:hypothetical protein
MSRGSVLLLVYRPGHWVGPRSRGRRADLIVTGDADLLALHPFHGIDLLTPAAYIEL